MELGIETIIEGDILEPGIIAIDARMFSDIIRKLPNNNILITTTDRFETLIICEKSRFVIPSQPGEEYTGLPDLDQENIRPVLISALDLKIMIQKSIFSASASDSNKLLMGEYFTISGHTLKVSALDGHRVAVTKLILQDDYDELAAIIPCKALTEISRILPDSDEEMVKIYFTDNLILFAFNRTVVVSRLVEGSYFDVDHMMSCSYNTKIQINNKDFKSSLERTLLLVQETDRKPVIFSIVDGHMNIMIRSGLGSLNEEIEVTKTGNDIRIGFNPRFLLDALKVIDDETVTMYFFNSLGPCFIKNDEESYNYMILPINMNTEGEE